MAPHKEMPVTRRVTRSIPRKAYTHIIIGGGTAGCLLANRLSNDPRRSILLLESGTKGGFSSAALDMFFTHPAIRVPAGYLHCIGNPKFDWCYKLQPEANLISSTDGGGSVGGRVIRYPRGRVLGGCSSINGMIYMRGQQRDYDQGWRMAAGNDPAWSWMRCVRYGFLKHEDHWRGSHWKDAQAEWASVVTPGGKMMLSSGVVQQPFQGLLDTSGHFRTTTEAPRKRLPGAAASASIPATDAEPEDEMTALVKARAAGEDMTTFKVASTSVGFAEATKSIGAEQFVYHGQGGEWRVEKQRVSWPLLDDFSSAASKMLGIPQVEDFNGGDNEGVGYFEVNQNKGVRCGAGDAFVNSTVLSYRKNLDVVVGATVTKLIIERKGGEAFGSLGVRGVEVLLSGAFADASGKKRGDPVRVELEPEGEAVLCAGAFGTPAILQRSGIGPEGVLKEAGVEKVLLNRPGVGTNLQDHLQLRAIYRLRDGVTEVPLQGASLNTRAATLSGKTQLVREYMWDQRGPLSMAPSQLGAFFRSNPDREKYPNLEFHVQPLSLDAFGEPLHKFDAITVSVCNLNPTSRGSVKIASTDPFDAPRVAMNYLDTEKDKVVARESIEAVRRVMKDSRSPMQQMYAAVEHAPGDTFRNDRELVEAAGRIGTTIFHASGSCAMGTEYDDGTAASGPTDHTDSDASRSSSNRPPRSTAVVNNRLRVMGIDGLRIADASIMPNITSGNTCSPTLMIAERCANWMLRGDDDL